jgi:hypothetical protein
MTPLIRIDLTGKDADRWNRIFGLFTTVIERSVDALVADDACNGGAKDLAADLLAISQGWLKAKVERPALENEKIVADVVQAFEQAKLLAAQRKQVEVETQIRNLDLWEKRLQLALKWMAFAQQHVVSGEDGSVTLVLTNQDLAMLTSELSNLPREALEGPSS